MNGYSLSEDTYMCILNVAFQVVSYIKADN